jgi:hypothetical protein
MVIRLLFSFVVLFATNVHALSGVHPTGVNVRSSGPTTVFLTFQDTAGQTGSDAFWCGEITVPAATVTNFNPCVPGTIYGRLPSRNNLGRQSGTSGITNFTDIMTVPSSVARRAYQDAQAGEKSDFFYVRRFSGTGEDQFVTVTCRMAGGGARVALALLNVNSYFKTANGDRPVYVMARNEQAPSMEATIHYNGSGRLKGRWEVVQPGDPEPTADDLLSEASLPVELRGLQRRYTVLDRIDMFLPPTGRAVIPGPSPNLIPTSLDGPYKILLRIEATQDKEGDSKTNAGVARSGGVAGFPLPVLRYYVGSADDTEQFRNQQVTGNLSLLLPLNDSKLSQSESPVFSWADIPEGILYRIEFGSEEATIISAFVKAGVSSYQPPPWLMENTGMALRWRVQALDQKGKILTQSDWRTFSVEEK